MFFVVLCCNTFVPCFSSLLYFYFSAVGVVYVLVVSTYNARDLHVARTKGPDQPLFRVFPLTLICAFRVLVLVSRGRRWPPLTPEEFRNSQLNRLAKTAGKVRRLLYPGLSEALTWGLGNSAPRQDGHVRRCVSLSLPQSNI